MYATFTFPLSCPQEMLRFYILWSVFWGLLRLLFAHAGRTYIYTVKIGVLIHMHKRFYTCKTSWSVQSVCLHYLVMLIPWLIHFHGYSPPSHRRHCSFQDQIFHSLAKFGIGMRPVMLVLNKLAQYSSANHGYRRLWLALSPGSPS